MANPDLFSPVAIGDATVVQSHVRQLAFGRSRVVVEIRSISQ